MKRVAPIKIKLPNGSIVSTTLIGTIVFTSDFYLTDVLYFPQFSFNLMSIPKMIKNLHCTFFFDDSRCLIQAKHSQKMIGAAELEDGLYLLKTPLASIVHTPSLHCVNNVKTMNKDCNLWHMRFGHASYDKLIEIKKNFPCVSISNSFDPCDVCFYAKQKRLPFSLSTHQSSKVFDLVHMDIWGPLAITSMFGFKYFLTIVDDKSRFTWVYLMRLKSETATIIKSFVNLVQTQFNSKIKTIRTDNGQEFILKDFYNATGILHQTSCVSTPQQNGIVERKHQHILGVARSLLFQSNLPKTFWAHAIGHAVHIINRLPSPFLSQKCPFQIVYDCLPDISSLKVFGSLCFASTLQANRHKLDSRSRKCVYLGYKQGVKGHILFDLLNKEIFISRDVIFFEHIFPYQSTVPSDSAHKPT
jgi:hypothetical protein